MDPKNSPLLALERHPGVKSDVRVPLTNFGPIDFRILYSVPVVHSQSELLKEGGDAPYLNATVFEQLIARFHAVHSYGWSFGGYLEPRSRLWKGSYLDGIGDEVLHAGIDVNLPKGTPLKAQQDFTVLLSDDDHTLSGGWGPRLILQPGVMDDRDCAVIYSHLQRIAVKEGDEVKKGAILGEIGGPPDNGNWWPHLHIQLVERSWFDTMRLHATLEKLDGYFPLRELAECRLRYPDPIKFMPLEWELDCVARVVGQGA